jgi:hypothetical protein
MDSRSARIAVESAACELADFVHRESAVPHDVRHVSNAGSTDEESAKPEIPAEGRAPLK